jgi:FkbM family methyltransferase
MIRKIRERLKFHLRWLTVRIKAGPLKGMKWIAVAGTNFFMGRYEEFKTEGLLKCVQPGDVVYDIGGHVGYYSVLSSVLAGPTGRVFVFEPRPLNIAFIKHHIRINGIENITLLETAVSDRAGEAAFEDRTGSGTGHLSEEGRLKVSTLVIDEFVDGESHPYPDFLKMDIEGGEIDALNGARRTIEKSRPNLLLATHGGATHSFVLDYLKQYDYTYEVLNPEAVKGDTEIVAFPAEKAMS